MWRARVHLLEHTELFDLSYKINLAAPQKNRHAVKTACGNAPSNGRKSIRCVTVFTSLSTPQTGLRLSLCFAHTRHAPSSVHPLWAHARASASCHGQRERESEHLSRRNTEFYDSRRTFGGCVISCKNCALVAKSLKFPLALPEKKMLGKSSRIMHLFLLYLILMQNIIYLMDLVIIYENYNGACVSS